MAKVKADPIRVLVAKVGLDGHDRGAKVVARALRDAGMEVIYTGIRQTPGMIAEVAAQEDVDVVGLSNLSGSYVEHYPQVIEKLREKGMEDVLVVVGGIFSDESIPWLHEIGVAQAFGPGSSLQDIIDFIREAVQRKREGVPS